MGYIVAPIAREILRDPIDWSAGAKILRRAVARIQQARQTKRPLTFSVIPQDRPEVRPL